MSRIKTEIDKALEYYGDQATVFRVVRRATNKTDSSLYRLRRARLAAQRKHRDGIITRKRRIRRYISHFRRLLPIDRPVTTERLKSVIIDSSQWCNSCIHLVDRNHETNERPQCKKLNQELDIYDGALRAEECCENKLKEPTDILDKKRLVLEDLL